MRSLRLAIAIVLLVSMGCASKKSSETLTRPTATTTPSPTPCAIQGANPADHNKESPGATAPVTDVRYSDQGCPRIVFQFTGRTPGYKIGYASPPFQDCGSGETANTTSWNAKAYLQIRLAPSGGVDLSKSSNPTYTGPRDITVDGTTLKHLKVTCDFEAVFIWVAGLDGKHPFNVQTLTDPPRIVVDVSPTTSAP